MLPHGGSRLNASKPEASPKTRCPKHYFLIFISFHIPPGAGKYASHGLLHEGGPTQHNNNSKHNHRIAIQAIAAGGCLEGAK